MKTFVIIAAFLLCAFTVETKVYVCDSPKAVAYHSRENCRGLQKCTHDIIAMSVAAAKDRGLRTCQICY